MLVNAGLPAMVCKIGSESLEAAKNDLDAL